VEMMTRHFRVVKMQYLVSDHNCNKGNEIHKSSVLASVMVLMLCEMLTDMFLLINKLKVLQFVRLCRYSHISYGLTSWNHLIPVFSL